MKHDFVSDTRPTKGMRTGNRVVCTRCGAECDPTYGSVDAWVVNGICKGKK